MVDQYCGWDGHRKHEGPVHWCKKTMDLLVVSVAVVAEVVSEWLTPDGEGHLLSPCYEQLTVKLERTK